MDFNMYSQQQRLQMLVLKGPSTGCLYVITALLHIITLYVFFFLCSSYKKNKNKNLQVSNGSYQADRP